MNRRNFLSTLIGGLAATAAVRSFPFRVFSFPKEIIVPRVGDIALTDIPLITADALASRFTNTRATRVSLSLHGLPYWSDVPPTVGTFYGIQRTKGPLFL